AIAVHNEPAGFSPVPAGGATIHHRLTCHGADANKPTSPRRAYAICFGVLADRPLVSREYPWNRQKVTERAERYRASLKPWHRMKEEVRFRLMRMGLL